MLDGAVTYEFQDGRAALAVRGARGSRCPRGAATVAEPALMGFVCSLSTARAETERVGCVSPPARRGGLDELAAMKPRDQA